MYLVLYCVLEELFPIWAHIEVHFISVDGGQDIKEVGEVISSGLYEDVLKDVVFDIMGGTAIIKCCHDTRGDKGDAKVEYFLQGCNKECKNRKA